MSSVFCNPGPTTRPESLAILYLRRDHYLPVLLESEQDAEDEVIHTRFGSFPHKSLLNIPWGSQVAATKVDGRGRVAKQASKRKREASLSDCSENGFGDATNSSHTKGFTYVLPPTPEKWTVSLPHRTQVVYTPDYSYVLQRLQVRPGTVVIEAGAGSGSFTHAAARAVFNGFSTETKDEKDPLHQIKKERKHGHVYSFEYHKPRVARLAKEIKQHGLSNIVSMTHRDVYKDGFSVPSREEYNVARSEIHADAIFLDLPAPWLALPHLNQHDIIPTVTDMKKPTADKTYTRGTDNTPTYMKMPFPIGKQTVTRLCSFSPCIEQVQRTVNELRKLGWSDIEVVENQHRNIDVRRERQGLREEGLRGVNASPLTVSEAVERQRHVEERLKAFHDMARETKKNSNDKLQLNRHQWNKKISALGPSKQERMEHNRAEEATRKLYKEGKIMHRTGMELKTHTSYLTFAIFVNEEEAKFSD